LLPPRLTLRNEAEVPCFATRLYYTYLRVCSVVEHSGMEWNHSIPIIWNVTVPSRFCVRLDKKR
jgi:hypothetical protein